MGCVRGPILIADRDAGHAFRHTTDFWATRLEFSATLTRICASTYCRVQATGADRNRRLSRCHGNWERERRGDRQGDVA